MNLKELRISKNITQKEASLITNISIRTYKRLENDISYISSHKYQYAYDLLSRYDISTPNKDKSKVYNILVIGAGYVGLSIATLLGVDNNVSIVDINIDKVNKINKREIIFKDKDIEFYFVNKKLNLKAYTPDKELYRHKDYIIIAIPTDYDETTNKLDTSNITNIVKDIRSINKSSIIVIKSTCNIGYTDSLKDNKIIYSPEFLREGKALYDNLYPSRIIIGGDKKNHHIKEFGDLLAIHAHNKAKTLYMSAKEAEAVKLFSNSYLALRVAYFNELDTFAIKEEMNNKNIILGVSTDPRIGDYYNNPSFGYGGYCLPKDTKSLISYIDNVISDGLISSIDRSNQKRKEFVINDILTKLKGIKSPIVGIYSVEAKKDSDNTRHASILDIIDGLKDKGINILYYDPSKISIEEFKAKSHIILANRMYTPLNDVISKVYTRDIFYRD